MFYNVTSYSANLIGQVVVCAIFQPYCLILVPMLKGLLYVSNHIEMKFTRHYQQHYGK